MNQLKQQEEQVPEEDGSEAMLNKAITAPVQWLELERAEALDTSILWWQIELLMYMEKLEKICLHGVHCNLQTRMELFVLNS